MSKPETTMTEKAVAAMKAAVNSVVEDHRRRNRPLSTWRDGKVVYLDPHDRSIVREDAAPYGQDNQAITKAKSA